MKSIARVSGDSNIEWIVIDGGSQIPNGNSGLLERVSSLTTQFVSEPDEGIYDAMNKGTDLATGDYVLYLNAGDELHPGFDPGSVEKLAQSDLPEMIWGQCMERYENGATIRIKTRSPSWAWYCMPIYHPAIFFRRDVLGIKPYDTGFRIAADYDLVCRLLTNGAKVKNLNATVSVFHRGGLSLTNADATRYEENLIRMKYFNVSPHTGKMIMKGKSVIAKLSHSSVLRNLWRRWI
jgi:putative colanic acid biosynthesis glycosyltransferase